MTLRDDLLTPIPGDNPGGEDVRYKPVYDQIKEARRQDEEVATGVWETTTKRADWNTVIKLSQEVLAKQSKDLQVAAWLTEALLHKEGAPGLAQGLDLCRALVEQFWDHLYPELEDGDAELRSVPLQFIVARAESRLRFQPIMKPDVDYYRWKDASLIPTEEESYSDDSKRQRRAAAVADGKLLPEQLEAAFAETPLEFFAKLRDDLGVARASVEALEPLAAEKFGEYAPGFGGLKDCLEELSAAVRGLWKKKGGVDSLAEEPAPEEIPPPEPQAAGGEAAPVEPVASAPPRRAAGAAQAAVPLDAADAAARIAAIARWYREQNAYSPVPFLLLRALRWGELRESGSSPAWDLLDAPPTAVRQNLKKLQQEYDHTGLLQAAEEAMALSCGRAWLDLQRYAISAAEGLGCAAVVQSIESELRALLRDYPELPSWTLSDDTPAANPQTQEFLKSRGLMGEPEPPPPPPPPEPAWQPEPYYQPPAAQEAEPGQPDDEQVIRDLLSQGRTEEAMQMVAHKLASETSGRSRFQRKTQLAQIMMAANRPAVAFPILKELVDEIGERRLDQWEPADVVVQPLVLYWRALEKTGGAEPERARVFSMISRLDPVRAFELG